MKVDWLTYAVTVAHSCRDTGSYMTVLAALQSRSMQRQANLSEESIAYADALIIMAPAEYFSEYQKADIDRYLRLGGTVIIVGDHTNVFGLQGPFNDLTDTYSIRINYDSALPVRSDRSCCFEETPFLRRLVGVGVDPAMNMSYLTGASLEAPANADILLAFKYGFEDQGDVNNSGRNAFLGNYRWEFGTEAIGDVILACSVPVGLGQLVAVGDTSIFQNISLNVQDTGLAFVALVVNRTPNIIPPLFVIAVGIFVGIQTRSGMYKENSIAMLCLVAAIVLSTPSVAPMSSLYLSQQSNRGVIDVSHSAAFSTGLWDDNSLSGLSLSIKRAGYRPKLVNRDILSELGNARLLIIPDDNTSYSPIEVEAILSWVREGGRLICAANGLGHRPLLSALGASLQDVPLGDWPNYALRYEAKIAIPEVVSGWSISDSISFPGEPLYTVCDSDGNFYDVVKKFEVDKGVVIVIGDVQVLTNAYLEGEDKWNASNVRFVESLLDYLR